MADMSLLMAVKVLGIVALGAVFVWWQFRDLAREKKRAAAKRELMANKDNTPS